MACNCSLWEQNVAEETVCRVHLDLQVPHVDEANDDTARDRMDTHVPMNSFLLVTRDFELYAEPVFVVATQLP